MTRRLAIIALAFSCAPDAVLVREPEPVPPCSGMYSTVPVGECDLYEQDCPDPEERCITFSDAGNYTTRCSPTFGGKQAGVACVGLAECDTGLICVAGSCSPVCCPETHARCDDGYCAAVQPYGNFMVRRCAYLEACDLFVNDCIDDDRCQVIQEFGVTLCVPPDGAQQEGDPCDSPADCQATQMCYAAVGDNGVCRYNCLLVGSSTVPGEGGCPASQQCAAFGYPDNTIGVCVP